MWFRAFSWVARLKFSWSLSYLTVGYIWVSILWLRLTRYDDLAVHNSFLASRHFLEDHWEPSITSGSTICAFLFSYPSYVCSDVIWDKWIQTTWEMAWKTPPQWLLSPYGNALFEPSTEFRKSHCCSIDVGIDRWHSFWLVVNGLGRPADQQGRIREFLAQIHRNTDCSSIIALAISMSRTSPYSKNDSDSKTAQNLLSIHRPAIWYDFLIPPPAFSSSIHFVSRI